MNITLIGYRGTGKTSVAQLLAERLGWEWVDADRYVELRAAQTIRQIFEAEGEDGFRQREAEAIRELVERDRWVIAAGGGAVLREENRDAIRRGGFAVWLIASPDVIEQRIATDPSTPNRRPPLTSRNGADEIRQLLEAREPLYRVCADFSIETNDLSPDQIADTIVKALAERLNLSSTE